MLQFDLRIQQRLPQWFRGSRVRIASPLLRTLGRWSRFDNFKAHLAESGRRRDVAAQGRPEPLAEAGDRATLCTAIAATELLGETGDGKQIRLSRLRADSPLLHEIGRLRELTFRKVGEGAGHSRDLDCYDTHYDHIILWDAQSQCIAGAYRVARGARVLAEHGIAIGVA